MDPVFDPKTDAQFQKTARAFLLQIQRAVERCDDIGNEALPDYLELLERLTLAYRSFLSPHASFAEDEDEGALDDDGYAP